MKDSIIINISEIKKTYEDITALDNVSFSVEKNTIFGIVGPDGAGKTTLIRILCGLIKADSGKAEILGFDLGRDLGKIKNEIGYLSQKFSLYTDLTVDENIEFIADIHGVRDFKKERNELLNFTRLTDFRNFLAGKLSGGMKQKLALACTLIYKPKIIFLDEPTTGVDPVSRREFWRILSNLSKENITVIISTPYLDEAERFNKLVLIDNGKILAVDTPENIKGLMKGSIIEIVCSPIRKAYQILRDNTTFEIQLFGDRLNIAAENYENSIDELKNILERNRIVINDIRKIPPSLENAYIHLIKENS